MPCNDGGVPYPETRLEKQWREDRENAPAILCGIMRAIQRLPGQPVSLNYVLNQVDWKEVGVSKKWALDWFARHQAEDAARQKREAVEKARIAAKKSGLAKLTKKEREALGLVRDPADEADEED